MTPSALSNETLDEQGLVSTVPTEVYLAYEDRAKAIAARAVQETPVAVKNAILRFVLEARKTALITELQSYRSEGVTVKPIVWRKTSYGAPEADTVVGIYRINHAMNGGWSVTIGRNLLREADGRENFASIQDAIDAAQLDYETRIKSALSPSTERGETIEGADGDALRASPPKPSEAMVEAAVGAWMSSAGASVHDIMRDALTAALSGGAK